MVEVFIYGCTSCGVNALHLKRLQKVHGESTVYNSTRKDNFEKHKAYLERAGIQDKNYPAIIVVNEGERIIRLSQWTLL